MSKLQLLSLRWQLMCGNWGFAVRCSCVCCWGESCLN